MMEDEKSESPNDHQLDVNQPNNDQHDNPISENNKFKFEPPLFIQRYDYVADLLKKYNCKTYMDIGCAECKLLRYLKNTNQDLNLIIGVDIDKEVLRQGDDILTSQWFDYIQTRERPLEVC